MSRCILTNVPSLCEDYAHGEQEEEHAGADPSVGDEGSGFVEVRLVHLFRSQDTAILRDYGFAMIPPWLECQRTCWYLDV